MGITFYRFVCIYVDCTVSYNSGFISCGYGEANSLPDFDEMVMKIKHYIVSISPVATAKFDVYEEQSSNTEIAKSVLSLFRDSAGVYERLEEIFQDDDVISDDVLLNKQSFDAFYWWLIRNEGKFSKYSIGLTNKGCVEFQYNGESKYVYVSFFSAENIFYNLYAKNTDCFDLVRTGSFSDFDRDYEQLCMVVN